MGPPFCLMLGTCLSALLQETFNKISLRALCGFLWGGVRAICRRLSLPKLLWQLALPFAFFLQFALKAKQKLEENSARWNVPEPFLGNQRQPKETEAAILGEVFHAKPFGPKNQPPAIWDSTGCSASKALTARRLAELPQKVCP